MFPLLTETSMQAQILIPMANSLCFGLVASTALVLILVPSFFLIYGHMTGLGSGDEGDDEPRDTLPRADLSQPAEIDSVTVDCEQPVNAP